MTVKITLEYGSVEEAIKALGLLSGLAKVRRAAAATPQPDALLALAPTPTVVTEAPAAATSITKNLVLPDTTKKPRGRPRKQEAAAGVTGGAQASRKVETSADPLVPAEVAPQTPAAASPVPTEAETKAALESYFEKHGPQKAMAKLSSFGVSRLRDLPEGQRAEFIKACSE